MNSHFVFWGKYLKKKSVLLLLQRSMVMSSRSYVLIPARFRKVVVFCSSSLSLSQSFVSIEVGICQISSRSPSRRGQSAEHDVVSVQLVHNCSKEKVRLEGWSSFVSLPIFANLSASSLPGIPQWAGSHLRAIFLSSPSLESDCLIFRRVRSSLSESRPCRADTVCKENIFSFV